MLSPAEQQAQALKTYMENFSRQVDVYKDSIESTRTNMMDNLTAEINKLGLPSSEEPKSYVMPDFSEPVKVGAETSTLPLNITTDEFYEILTGVNKLMIRLLQAVTVS